MKSEELKRVISHVLRLLSCSPPHTPTSTHSGDELQQSKQDEMQCSYSFIWFIKRQKVTKWEEIRSNILDPYEKLKASLLICNISFKLALCVFKKTLRYGRGQEWREETRVAWRCSWIEGKAKRWLFHRQVSIPQARGTVMVPHSWPRDRMTVRHF